MSQLSVLTRCVRVLPAAPSSHWRPWRVSRCAPVACLRGSSDVPVFETWPARGEATLFEARDAIDACAGLEGEEAEACFLVFGLDCRRTRKWFPAVAKLEAQLAETEDLDVADDDDTHDCKANPWGLPQPLNEAAALWLDVAADLKRMHDSSARD